MAYLEKIYGTLQDIKYLELLPWKKEIPLESDFSFIASDEAIYIYHKQTNEYLFLGWETGNKLVIRNFAMQPSRALKSLKLFKSYIMKI